MRKRAFKNLKGYGLPKPDHIPSVFLKAVFHKFYLVHSWIFRPKYCAGLLGYARIWHSVFFNPHSFSMYVYMNICVTWMICVLWITYDHTIYYIYIYVVDLIYIYIYLKDPPHYIGLTENTFKDRLYKHNNSFKYENKRTVPNFQIRMGQKERSRRHHLSKARLLNKQTEIISKCRHENKYQHHLKSYYIRQVFFVCFIVYFIVWRSPPCWKLAVTK